MFDNVRRIFFDSGMVLCYPKSGEWFYPLKYKEYCKEKRLPEKSFRQNINYQKACYHLGNIKTIKSEDEEYEVFREFYKILFHTIKGKDNRELIELCANACVFDYEKYEFYDDVKESIKRLKYKYDLGIISDAWPSLFNVYRHNDMYKHFEPFIISSMYGCTKQEYDLFRFGLANVAEHPEDILFVDDSYENCMRAAKLGMNVIVLNRNKYYRSRKNILHVSNMEELEKVVGI
jgi:putative hydrolase of the HAD superfamily